MRDRLDRSKKIENKSRQNKEFEIFKFRTCDYGYIGNNRGTYL
jgi:hypothetical protein